MKFRVVMQNILRYSLFALAWGVVVAYVVYASLSARSHRSQQTVARTNIIIVDSSSSSKLVTTPMVEKWIAQSKVRTVGRPIDSLDLVSLESHIKASGFVAEVKAYTTYRGELNIEVEQLHPVLRLMVDGYNSYVTTDGYIFQRPPASARYVPVITGEWSLLFRPGYSGLASESYEAQLEELEAEIERLEKKNIYPLYAKQIKSREQLRTVNRRYTNRRLGESRKSADRRIAELKERNSQERAIYTAALRQVQKDIEIEQQKQNLFRLKQKKLEKRYKDFINLITFVEIIEKDKFWSSEIVQIVAREASNGALQLELIPRSGNHTITFGEVENVEDKLKNLRTFYKEVMPNKRWEGVDNINVEYRDQVVYKGEM